MVQAILIETFLVLITPSSFLGPWPALFDAVVVTTGVGFCIGYFGRRFRTKAAEDAEAHTAPEKPKKKHRPKRRRGLYKSKRR
jgi:hypothetical protein